MKIISVSFQLIPGDVTDVLMNKGYVENEYDNINIVKFKPWSIFSVPDTWIPKCHGILPASSLPQKIKSNYKIPKSVFFLLCELLLSWYFYND